MLLTSLPWTIPMSNSTGETNAPVNQSRGAQGIYDFLQASSKSHLSAYLKGLENAVRIQARDERVQRLLLALEHEATNPEYLAMYGDWLTEQLRLPSGLDEPITEEWLVSTCCQFTVFISHSQYTYHIINHTDAVIISCRERSTGLWDCLLSSGPIRMRSGMKTRKQVVLLLEALSDTPWPEIVAHNRRQHEEMMKRTARSAANESDSDPTDDRVEEFRQWLNGNNFRLFDGGIGQQQLALVTRFLDGPYLERLRTLATDVFIRSLWYAHADQSQSRSEPRADLLRMIYTTTQTMGISSRLREYLRLPTPTDPEPSSPQTPEDASSERD
jgi:hypothetical protein